MKRLTNSYTSPKPLFFRYTSPRLKQNLSSGNAKTLFSHQNISCLYLYAGIYDLTLNDKCSLFSQARYIGGHYARIVYGVDIKNNSSNNCLN